VLVFAFFAPAHAAGFVHAVTVSAAVAASIAEAAEAAHVAEAAPAAVEFQQARLAIRKTVCPCRYRVLQGLAPFCFRHDGQNAIHNLKMRENRRCVQCGYHRQKLSLLLTKRFCLRQNLKEE